MDAKEEITGHETLRARARFGHGRHRWVLATLVCGMSLTSAAQAVDCESLWQRNPPYPGWYDHNPSYPNRPDDQADLLKKTPKEEGMNGAMLEAGVGADDGLNAADPSKSHLLSVLVLRNDAIIYENYLAEHGGDRRTSNNIHSASKSLLRLLIGLAFQADPNSPPLNQVKVSEVLPEYFRNSSEAARRLTLADFVSMTAGLTWNENKTEERIAATDNADWVQEVIKREPNRLVPGHFNYSTGLTQVLAAAVERETGQSLCQFAHTALLDKMNIAAAHWGRDPGNDPDHRDVYFSGGYNVYLTPHEMAKLGLLMLHKGQWPADGTWPIGDKPVVQLLPPGVIDEATTQTSTAANDGIWTYGQLFWLRTMQRKSKDVKMYLAWGFRGQFIYVIPDYNLIVITTEDTNDDHEDGSCKDYDDPETMPDDCEVNIGNYLQNYVLKAIDGP